MDRKNFAFGKMNFILTLAGVVIILIGFLLMSGPGSTEEMFNPDIFSARRIVVAPTVTLIGYITVMVAIMYKSKKEE